jgi:hypothetical protein
MKELLHASSVILLIFALAGMTDAATQDKYDLPEPYLGWEKAYLEEFPVLQALMDEMIHTTIGQLEDPDSDILHNRVCSALAYRMAKQLPEDARKLAVATDLLHNISKEEKRAILTNPEIFQQSARMVAELKKAGYFKGSDQFWSDEAILRHPKIGPNRALIHHITGALKAGQIVGYIKGFSEKDVAEMQVATLEHSTGYWYFRASVDEAAGQKEAWRVVYPEPENEIAKIAHDADLISQFVPESVVPDGSKWRELAKKRWGARTVPEEGQIVYYVFLRLFEEAKTEMGREMAREKWATIKPALIKLMGLNPDQDPIKVLGVPKIFQ